MTKRDLMTRIKHLLGERGHGLPVGAPPSLATLQAIAEALEEAQAERDQAAAIEAQRQAIYRRRD